MTKRIFCILLLIPLLLCSETARAQYQPHKGSESNPVLTIEGGQLIGVESGTPGVNVYRGIPYAAPPVGDLRWREAAPVIPWSGVKRADAFGPACTQRDHTPGEFYQIEFFSDGDPVRSEDCLYLNIWTPAAGETDAGLPVAMWIHGGGMVAGWGHEMEFDGADWAKRGVILVTINYRLGIAGFFAHPLLTAESEHNSSGNYGILDQLAALRWINNNIDQFGGDPGNVTIFGQSGGGRSVQTLAASPLAEGLLHRAIIQSSLYAFPGVGDGGLGPLQQPELETLEQVGAGVMDSGGVRTLEEMRALPLEEVERLVANYSEEHDTSVRFGYNIDGYLTVGSFPELAVEGKIPDIPYMVGYTGDDMARGGQTMDGPITAFSLALEDLGREPAFTYLFDRKMPGDDAGAFHSAELWYVFGTLDRCWRPMTPADYLLSERMINYWTNFAKTGDPNGTGLAPWDRCSEENQFFKRFDIE